MFLPVATHVTCSNVTSASCVPVSAVLTRGRRRCTFCSGALRFQWRGLSICLGCGQRKRQLQLLLFYQRRVGLQAHTHIQFYNRGCVSEST